MRLHARVFLRNAVNISLAKETSPNTRTKTLSHYTHIKNYMISVFILFAIWSLSNEVIHYKKDIKSYNAEEKKRKSNTSKQPFIVYRFMPWKYISFLKFPLVFTLHILKMYVQRYFIFIFQPFVCADPFFAWMRGDFITYTLSLI